jgi:BASS family bile acid:Na+ symporter
MLAVLLTAPAFFQPASLRSATSRPALATPCRKHATARCQLQDGAKKTDIDVSQAAAQTRELLEQDAKVWAAPMDAVVEVEVEGKAIRNFRAFSNGFSNLFPVWTLSVAALGLFTPSVFLGISTSYFTGLLGLLMLSMGITLTVDDFKRVLMRPGVMVFGFLGCYGLMPAMALLLSRGLGLSPALTAGMILVGSINGGQASNLCAYIAKGDVALSVLMTTVTTVGAIFMTPLISKLLLGTLVPVDAVGVAVSTIQVVLLPIVLGMLANAKFPKAVRKIEPFSPIVGVLSTCVLVGSAVAQCSAPIRAAGVKLQVAAAALHIVGGLAAYFAAKAWKYSETTCRTVAIETSMKSSAFGFLLAKLHFAQFLVRVPAAVSVVWMALVGSSMAVAFRAMPVPDEEAAVPLEE